MNNSPMAEGRQAGTDRRRKRVIASLQAAVRGGTEVSVSAVARHAGVDRTFLYRHRDLLDQIHTAALQPAAAVSPAGAAPVSVISLTADIANAHARNTRLTARIRQLEHRLSTALGEQVWAESGVGSPADTSELQRTITRLEQRAVQLTADLRARDADLEASRAANRDLTRALNQRR
ncbi:DUF6262 family protein [Streptomyces sp. NPDC059209]|uniref:DUF6262 family protein n=1 Tax=Streptomyces sp. NPDC059209 TaxID=3346769 RepID=UPI0036B1C21C